MVNSLESLKIIPIPTTQYVDVFQGEGWKHHTRLCWNKKEKTIHRLNGEKLSKLQFKFIATQLDAKLP